MRRRRRWRRSVFLGGDGVTHGDDTAPHLFKRRLNVSSVDDEVTAAQFGDKRVLDVMHRLDVVISAASRSIYTRNQTPIHCNKYPYIFCGEFSILTEPVLYTFASVNRRNNEAQAHIITWARASLLNEWMSQDKKGYKATYTCPWVHIRIFYRVYDVTL